MITASYRNGCWSIKCEGMKYPYYRVYLQKGWWVLYKVEELDTKGVFQTLAGIEDCISIARKKLIDYKNKCV